MTCIKAKGVLNIFLGDRVLRLQGDSELEIYPSAQVREASTNGEFTIKERSPSISGTFHVPDDMRVQEIVEASCVKLTVELTDGRVFVMSNASQVGQNAYQARAGTIDLEFIAESCEERLPTAS